MKEQKHYTLEIEPLTAVHIGSGRTLNPLDYKLGAINGGKKRIYMKYNTDKILGAIAASGDKKALVAFERATVTGNFGAVEGFFHNQVDSMIAKHNFDFLEYPCAFTNGFNRRYNSKIDEDPTQNALEVEQMYRPAGKQGAVIPGSSIKGAVRTAVLNYILLHNKEMPNDEYARVKRMGKDGKREKDIQKAVLGIDKCQGKANDAQKDPMRCVAFSDGKFDPRASLVGCLSNVGLGDGNVLEPSDMQIMAEVAAGRLAGYGHKALAAAAIDVPLQNVETDDGFGFARKFSMADIAHACNWFFKRQFDVDGEKHKSEYSKFYDGQTSGMELIEKLKEIVDSIEENDTSRFLLRVGRWSQVEYVTLGNDFREPDTPRRNGIQMPYGTTRTLFDMDGQWLPMGWCLVKVKEE